MFVQLFFNGAHQQRHNLIPLLRISPKNPVHWVRTCNYGLKSSWFRNKGNREGINLWAQGVLGLATMDSRVLCSAQSILKEYNS